MGFLNDIFSNILSQPKTTKVNATWNGAGDPEEQKAYIKYKIKAIERMEEEKDPKIKRRMQLMIEEGIYDFSEIENF